MSEVENLYSLAGVEKQEYGYCDWDSDCPYTNDEEICCNKTCPYFKIERIDYPPFTAEKQIAITELLGNYNAFYDEDNEYFSFITNHKDKNGIVRGYQGVGKNTGEAVASIICNLWQDLTEAEQNEMKNILKGERFVDINKT